MPNEFLMVTDVEDGVLEVAMNDHDVVSIQRAEGEMNFPLGEAKPWRQDCPRRTRLSILNWCPSWIYFAGLP